MAQALNAEVIRARLHDTFTRARELTAQHQVHPEYRSPFGTRLPEAVVFTSNSMRKAVLLYWELVCQYDLSSWPAFAAHIPYIPEEITTALSVHRYFEEHIHNGDGTVREPFVIGCLPDGVPVILCPTDGETHANEDPVLEAQNKIDHAREHFIGRDVVLISSDAVQHIRTAGHEKLGKPENSRMYKEMLEKGRYLGIDAEQVQESFRELYKKRYYEVSDGEPLIDTHITGVVAERGTKRVTREFSLSVEIQDWMLAQVEICMDMGGGGVFQQFIDLLAQENPHAWLDLEPTEMKSHLESHSPELWPYVIIFQIMGMPAMIHAVFAELNREEEEP